MTPKPLTAEGAEKHPRSQGTAKTETTAFLPDGVDSSMTILFAGIR